jgi:glycosyltransferase involved in cell wall biosynthesis
MEIISRKLINVVTPCRNEEENIEELYERVKSVFNKLDYLYEHIYIDNASTDRTEEILRKLAAQDPRVKVILNTRNFGHIRSPYHAFLQTSADAVITMACDLQDPPEKIPEFINKWEEGYKVVIGVKTSSQEPGVFYFLRTIYYNILRRLSDVSLIDNFTGFGLYDRKVVNILREYNDPYPYFRGLIADIGYDIAQIKFTQPRRKHGISKNNFYTLYDIAMLGFTNYTKVPLRLATMLGFLTAIFSFLVGLFYLLYKLIFWQEFTLGSAPIIVGLFFFGAVQLYIGAIYTQVLHRPLVIEKERINFEKEPQKN